MERQALLGPTSRGTPLNQNGDPLRITARFNRPFRTRPPSTLLIPCFSFDSSLCQSKYTPHTSPHYRLLSRRVTLSTVTYVVIHPTDGSPDRTILQIDQEHRKRGWAMIGYNYVVAGSGTSWSARPNHFVSRGGLGVVPSASILSLPANFNRAFQTPPPLRPTQLATLDSTGRGRSSRVSATQSHNRLSPCRDHC